MASELETGLPSVRHLQMLVRDKAHVRVMLTTGEELQGKIRWQDPHCLCLLADDQRTRLVWFHSLAYVEIIPLS